MFDNFYGQDRPVRVRGCDCPGCGLPGEHRAPRDKDLSGYYFFCLEHVREYNSKWDYFSGMSGNQIEQSIRDATVWERPTWPLGQWQLREQQLREDIMREFFGEEAPVKPAPDPTFSKAAREALTQLELQPPVDFVAIKLQYRSLVKRHHPDANNGSREAEERFKDINQAFAVLKGLYGEDAA